MEGVGDRCFRKSMASIGGFDEAVADFLRVPSNAHVQSLARVYDPQETYPLPLAAQLMGSDIELMASMAKEIERRGAQRIDLNCGCPSNTVTGRGAGSSLLKTPDHLHKVAKAMVRAITIPVTIKMRSGYEDTSLFKENLLAAEESGVSYITLHPRTKAQGYADFAQWELIAEAKSFLKIPVVGNGDILTVSDAIRMLETTHCDALMIGRGSIINPFLFHQIRSHFAKKTFLPRLENLLEYLNTYRSFIPQESSERLKINKLKQLMGFLFKATPELLTLRQKMLTAIHPDFASFYHHSIRLLQEGWNAPQPT
ncbi:MAG: tRNA-dihydrouridine synthase family protein [Chlamydiales bacterium]|nr:tRNA-dihydrouridine synthase family protein [Chlamydiales bacterium]